jgi:hypothetical protein
LSDIAIVFAIVAAIVVVFVWNRLPVVVVAMAAGLSLYVAGILGVGEVFAGFGDPA